MFLEIPGGTSPFFCSLDDSARLKGIPNDKMMDLFGLQDFFQFIVGFKSNRYDDLVDWGKDLFSALYKDCYKRFFNFLYSGIEKESASSFFEPGVQHIAVGGDFENRRTFKDFNQGDLRSFLAQIIGCFHANQPAANHYRMFSRWNLPAQNLPGITDQGKVNPGNVRFELFTPKLANVTLRSPQPG